MPARTERVSEWVEDLLARMTPEEKVAQLVGYWVDQGADVVAPMQGEMAGTDDYGEATRHGLGHLTRVYGTRPVDPVERAAWLWDKQRRLVSETRLGIPALVHEECLTGLAAWTAATFPTPLAWGAAFDPDLVEEMGWVIGKSMRELGIHQGLAPVLDVIRDPRWGRVDECIAEDPHVVATIGTAYVLGLQRAGVHATLKHFVGYSASQAGRNHAPVHAGPRELADVLLPPFEMAVRHGGARSVMNSYAEIDGVPVAATPVWLTDLLREDWGFDGVVVSDYFAVAFLALMHGVAADLGEAAQMALTAGVDVELPTGDAYLGPLLERMRDGRTAQDLVDRSVRRVLMQKEDLGLLDESFETPPVRIDLDSPEHRRIARVLAEQSLVLLSNNGVLPLGGAARRIAVIGPEADRPEALMGCYSFTNHVLAHHPDIPLGFEIPTVAAAIRAEFPDAVVEVAVGCAVQGHDRSGIDDARRLAADADVVVVVVGDQAGLFGRGTVGEGNDTASLDLPGLQRQLVEALIATGTPVVMVLTTGRPYVLDWALEGDSPPAAVVQAFFPGEEGGPAIAGLISGRVSPSGHLPVSLPRSAGAQPYSYLHPALGGPNEVTALDPTPVRPFGFGLTYTSFEHTDLLVEDRVIAGQEFRVSVRVRNVGDCDGVDLVQLYARDPVASVTRPVAQLIGYRRVKLAAGEEAEVRFVIPTAALAFSDRRMVLVVEPGEIRLWVGSSCSVEETRAAFEIVGPVYEVAPGDDVRVQSRVHRSVPTPSS